jgi:UPF0716 protein FxsA
MRFPFIPLFLLALPFLEIAGFVVVGRQIGVLATLGLVIGAMVLGAILLRVQGFGVMSRIRNELDAGQDPSRELANGVMIFVAGILLLIPGFITDIIGLLLFLPLVRNLAWRFLKGRIVISAAGFGGFSQARRRSRGKTIDLDADEYSHDSRPDSPWRRIDRE